MLNATRLIKRLFQKGRLVLKLTFKMGNESIGCYKSIDFNTQLLCSLLSARPQWGWREAGPARRYCVVGALSGRQCGLADVFPLGRSCFALHVLREFLNRKDL